MRRKNNYTTPQANHEEGPRPLYAHVTRQQEQRQREPTQREQRTREPPQSRPTQRESNSRRVKQSQTIEVDPKKYVKQVIKAILPQILAPLVQIIVEVMTIPGESSGKIERVKKVMQDAIKQACTGTFLTEEYSSDDDDEYQPSQSEHEDSEEYDFEQEDEEESTAMETLGPEVQEKRTNPQHQAGQESNTEDTH